MLGIPGMLKLCSADSWYFPSFQIEGSKIYLYVDAFGGLLLTRMCQEELKVEWTCFCLMLLS
jgi:hypothetical protein